LKKRLDEAPDEAPDEVLGGIEEAGSVQHAAYRRWRGEEFGDGEGEVRDEVRDLVQG